MNRMEAAQYDTARIRINDDNVSVMLLQNQSFPDAPAFCATMLAASADYSIYTSESV